VKTVDASTKAEQRAETMEQILDAAEYLFSKHGLYGVTLKDVAKRVGVHHTLLNYYFEDKKKLFDAVFARRAVVTSERRMRALDEYDARPTASRRSRARCAPSSTPTSISISTAATAGRITPRSARRSPTRPNGAPS
jgi:AcrR family transcriptional regulator